jgi:hypothetical protein
MKLLIYKVQVIKKILFFISHLNDCKYGGDWDFFKPEAKFGKRKVRLATAVEFGTRNLSNKLHIQTKFNGKLLD